MKLILSEILKNVILMLILRKSGQNSDQPMLMNLSHGHDSKLCKRHITQRTSRLNAKIRRLKTNGITYLDLIRLDAGGKPSTWSPPGKLSELSRIKLKEISVWKIHLKIQTNKYENMSEHAIVIAGGN